GQVAEQFDGEPLRGAVRPFPLARADPRGAGDVQPDVGTAPFTPEDRRIVPHVAADRDIDFVDHVDSSSVLPGRPPQAVLPRAALAREGNTDGSTQSSEVSS